MQEDILDAPVKGVEIQNNALSSLSEAAREKLYQYAVNLMTTGFSNDQIREKLENRGHSPEVAAHIVSQLGIARIQTDNVKKAGKGNPGLDIALGIGLIVIGIVLSGSNTGRIFYGAVIVGIFRLVKGIIALAND